MESHLQHRVTHLSEMRADLQPAPADWVMSLIERQPNDRPTTAKIALRTFRHARDPNRAEEDETASVVIGGTSDEPTAPQFMVKGEEDLPSTAPKKWLAAAAILLALGIGAYVISLPPKDSETSAPVTQVQDTPTPESPAPDSQPRPLPPQSTDHWLGEEPICVPRCELPEATG